MNTLVFRPQICNINPVVCAYIVGLVCTEIHAKY